MKELVEVGQGAPQAGKRGRRANGERRALEPGGPDAECVAVVHFAFVSLSRSPAGTSFIVAAWLSWSARM